MSFEVKLKEMNKLFFETEKQLVEFSNTVPLDNPQETYSPRLYSILQFSCSQIHGLFKMICGNLDLHPKDDFPSYFEVLNENKMLHKQEVVLLEHLVTLRPFNESETRHDWWASYNDTKHNLPAGIKQGTIGNTINAVSAVLILNRICYYLQHPLGEKKNFLKGEFWNSNASDFLERPIISLYQFGEHKPLSKILFYAMYYRPPGSGL